MALANLGRRTDARLTETDDLVVMRRDIGTVMQRPWGGTVCEFRWGEREPARQ
jgi:hypothetical protein